MAFKSEYGPFRSKFGEDIFRQKYAHDGAETWYKLVDCLVDRIVKPHLPEDVSLCKRIMYNMQFIPGGRYLYYANRKAAFFNNCGLLKGEEDTREEWGNMTHKYMSMLMTGMGVGGVYSAFRGSGSTLSRTGGIASGPLSLMKINNEAGRYVMQGGTRRSALWAGLHWNHPDIKRFIHAKDWYDMPAGNTTIGKLKEKDFNFHAPLDFTNISTIFDKGWHDSYHNNDELAYRVFWETLENAIRTGEPGFSFDVQNPDESLRNACTEITSEDDSDVCNLGSINLANIDDSDVLLNSIYVGTVFLICGTLEAQLPYEKMAVVRAKNRRLGLGIMGIHEWFIKHGLKYGEYSGDFRNLLEVYATMSRSVADSKADYLGISSPIACRAIAPTGTIGIIAGTTTGIEPVYAVAYKRRYLRGKQWVYQNVVDSTAETLVEQGIKPEDIKDTAYSLAKDPIRRIEFQAFVQRYVDQGISSTINLPRNSNINIDKVGACIIENSHVLRGLTFYPDGARGGQPLTPIDYDEAVRTNGIVYEDNDSCKGGVCGI